MVDLNTILVPTDFSDASVAALTHASRLAEALHADLTVLHTIEPPYPFNADDEFYTPPADWFASREAETREHVESVLTPEQQERYHTTVVVRHGSPAREILQYLHEHAAVHLVVMATHGRGGVARLMMGSVADTIVRTAPCPVLTLRVPEVRAAAARPAA